jgi:hypothetical protein
MKKYLTILLATILSTVILFSCKKSNSAAPKDYAASVKNKTWWGSFNYTRDTTQYYSVHFNTDNTFLWSQLSGDYIGKWSVNDKALTMSFDASTAIIKATITDDDKLAGITDNTSLYEIKSGQLIENPSIPLDNTVWTGWVYPVISTGTLTPIKLSFLPGNAIVILKAGVSFGPYAYTRSASGAVIKTTHTVINPYYTDPFFCVITSATEMKGSDAGAAFRWNAIKQ